MTRRLVWTLVVVLAGCDEGASGALAPLLVNEGDPCRPHYQLCIDAERVRECIDDVWVDRSCEEHCADIGPAMMSAGCAEVSLEVSVEGCECVPEPGSCAPGDTRCDSETELGFCDAQQVWTTHACEDLCTENLATPISTGCDLDEDGVAACWCAAE